MKRGKKDDRLIEFVCTIINIPTISGEPDGYRKIASVIGDEMGRAGLSVSFLESDPGFINVIGRKGCGRNGRRILFNGHVDVVPARMEDWLTDPFEADIRNGRIWGRGACDMKGGLAAMIFAAERAVRALNNFEGELIITATVDEEIGGLRGLKHLVDHGITADMAVVCEPTSLQISHVFKSLLWVKLVTKGKEAHGSNPGIGVNAISKMAKLLNGLSHFSDPYPSHELLGKPTLNIGTISGGSKPNVVPSRCEVEMDVRFLPGQSIEMVLKRITELIEEAKQEDREIEGEISSVIRKRIGFEIDEDAPLVHLLRKAAKEVTGSYPALRGMTSPGDCEHLMAAGIPSVMFGPGDDKDAHVSNESVKVDQVIEAAEIYESIILDFFNSKRRTNVFSA